MERFVKKMWIGLVGVWTFTAALNADGFDESERGLIAGKDVPFPPSESVLPENEEDSTTGGSGGMSEQDTTPDNGYQDDNVPDSDEQTYGDDDE
jgi:hypothetical protein